MTHLTMVITTTNAQTVEIANKDQSDTNIPSVVRLLYQHSWNTTQSANQIQEPELTVVENIKHMYCITIYTLHKALYSL